MSFLPNRETGFKGIFRRDPPIDLMPKTDEADLIERPKTGSQALKRLAGSKNRIKEMNKQIGVIKARIDAHDDIPEYAAVLSKPGGELELSEANREGLAVCLIQDKDIAMFKIQSPEFEHETTLLKKRAREQDYQVTAIYTVHSSIISKIYGFSSSKSFYSEGEYPKLFDEIVLAAVKANASDIHKYHAPAGGDIRLRVNGDLMYHRSLKAEISDTLSRSIYTLGQQHSGGTEWDPGKLLDARIIRNVNGEMVRLRFANIPTDDGHKITMRVLYAKHGDVNSLEALGFTPGAIEFQERVLSRGSGMVIIVGETGSGKSTTLQTMLSMLIERQEGRKLTITLENPVEYPIKGAVQCPVSGEGDFHRALRNLLRQDPDNMMINEIRDKETAMASQHAVQTGHKFFSTLHAPDPIQAVKRLMDLGMDGSVVCSDGFLQEIIAQVLLPVSCPECSLSLAEASAVYPADLIERLMRVVDRNELFDVRFKGEGCDHCKNTGKIGRIAAVSIFAPERNILQHIRNGDLGMATDLWRTQNSRICSVQGITLLDEGIRLIKEGIVCPSVVEEKISWLDDQETVSEIRNRLPDLKRVK